MTQRAANDDSTRSELIEMEAQRCSAMIDADFERLREILHPDLIHVHAKGQVDDHESYFASGGVQVDYKTLDRSEMEVKVWVTAR